MTDLTNTSWKFNTTVSSISFGGGTIEITLKIGLTYYFGISWSSGTLRYGSTNVYTSGAWLDESYRDVEIIGGTDATNIKAIDWLFANAELQGTLDGTMTSPNGVKIKTAGRAFDKDIVITPTLQSKTVEYSGGEKTVTADNGYVGLSSVTVEPVNYGYTVHNGVITIINTPS